MRGKRFTALILSVVLGITLCEHAGSITAMAAVQDIQNLEEGPESEEVLPVQAEPGDTDLPSLQEHDTTADTEAVKIEDDIEVDGENDLEEANDTLEPQNLEEPQDPEEMQSYEEVENTNELTDAEEEEDTKELSTSEEIIEAGEQQDFQAAKDAEVPQNVEESQETQEIAEDVSGTDMMQIIYGEGITDDISSKAMNEIIGLDTVDEIWQAERIGTDVTEALDGCIMAGVSGKYISESNAALRVINDIRKEACEEGVPNPITGEPLTMKDYVEIKWSEDLEYIARIRAAESAFTGYHARTNARSIWGLYSPKGIQSNGEVLAWNFSDSVTRGIYQWYEEKEDWVNQNHDAVTGHYTSMINPRNRYVGLGTFCSDEVYFYNTTAGEFSRYSSLDESRMDFSGNCVQMLEMSKEYLDNYQIVGTLPEATGDKQRLMLAANTKFAYSTGLVYLFDGVNWSSSNPSVISVTQDGVVEAVGSGTATIKATASDGTVSAEVQCTVKGLESWTVELSQGAYTYDGTEKRPGVTVAFEGNTLTEGVDYSVTYANNVNAGTATVRITGKGDYSGVLTKTFTIAKAQQILTASPATSSLMVGATAGINVNGIGMISYSSGDTSIVTVSDDGLLTGVGEGTATITVAASGNSNYLEDETSFVINVYYSTASIPIENCEVSIRQTGYIYTGGEVEPELTVRYDGSELNKGTDYFAAYKNNVNAGTASVTIYGMKNYTGSVTKTFTIAKASQDLKAGLAVNSIGVGQTAKIITDGFGTFGYSSSDTSVVTVSEDGWIEAIHEGNAVITVTASGDSNHLEAETSFEVTVTGAYEVAWQNCGEDAKWTYYSDGTIRISGNGAVELTKNSDGRYLWDYFYSSDYPKVHTVIIEEGITDIGDDFFSVQRYSSGFGHMTDSPEKIIIGDSVKTIGLRAFYNCDNLETVVFGASVSSLDAFVFSYCPSLKEVVVSEDNETFKSVGGVLFSKDGTALYKLPGSGITDYAIPEGVNTLKVDCMADIPALATISVPESMRTIESYALDGSDNITDVYFAGSKADWRAVTIKENNDVLEKATIHFALANSPINKCEVSVNGAEFIYNGKAWEPGVTLTYKGLTLSEGTDYTVRYKNNKDAGTAQVILTGIGDFSGTRKASFAIKKADQLIVADTEILTVLMGQPIDVSVTGAIGTLTCEIMNPSAANVAVSGKVITVTGTKTGVTKLIIRAEETANYMAGEIRLDLRIVPGKTTRGDMFNLANNVKVTWTEVPGAKYYKVYREGITDPNESRAEPVIVTERLIGWDSKPGLTNGNAYRYKIVASLTGKGDPSGDSPLSYSKVMYRLKTVVIRSAKNTAPGKVTVKYDKTICGDSYVLQYGDREDMVGAKTKVVLGANNTSYVLSGLQKGKTYYISIRVRKKVDGINYYTTFGVPKKVKITR